MSMNLHAASNQWSSRPADERYSDLATLLAACKRDMGEGKQRAVSLRDMRINGDGPALYLTGKRNDTQVQITNHAFTQLCNRLGAPAYYLQTLPGELAARAIQHGMSSLTDEEAQCKALFRVNGVTQLRALSSLRYDRVWDAVICERAIGLTENGWKVPPARPAMSGQPGTRKATQADVLAASQHFGLGIKVGDTIAPAGLYRGDKDMFIFMVDETRPIIEPGAVAPKFRGFFLRNSEVGAGALELTMFLYDAVCGNHIVWGAEAVKRVRARHIDTNATHALGDVAPALRLYAESSTKDTVKMLTAARQTMIADTRMGVIDAVYALRYQRIGKGEISRAFDIADSDAGRARGYGDAHSVYGIVSGLTQLSQEEHNADMRHAIDAAAGKLLATAA